MAPDRVQRGIVLVDPGHRAAAVTLHTGDTHPQVMQILFLGFVAFLAAHFRTVIDNIVMGIDLEAGTPQVRAAGAHSPESGFAAGQLLIEAIGTGQCILIPEIARSGEIPGGLRGLPEHGRGHDKYPNKTDYGAADRHQLTLPRIGYGQVTARPLPSLRQGPVVWSGHPSASADRPVPRPCACGRSGRSWEHRSRWYLLAESP